ncbi:MAG TPA: glycosyltransferase [Actinomycetota bacterium]|jgi:glycosyltransferase involved in cell wall biosynthesis|nr:glycosyltransferase [Actinomycetota bacterium]
MKVSLIATVLNADEHMDAFLASVAAQERMPDEVIIVDGGSTDGTLQRLRDAGDAITLIEDPGANIARGRNLAIAAASHDAIAVADADCAYGPGWLAALIAPLEEGADIAMGWTEPVVGSLLDACVASLGFPLGAAQVDETTFMPSARSVAFRREAIEAVGGYPEWLPIGEDMWVNHRWRERGFAMRMAPNAVASWHPRGSLAQIWTQYERYARGDGQAGMYPERHALRFAVYGGLLAALASRRTWPKLLAAGGAVAYARTPITRARVRLTDPRDRALATIAVPGLLAFTDVAKMWGYALGLADRLTGRVRPQ